MADPSEEIDPLAELADEFLERERRGEGPSVEAFLDRAPGRREELRELLSALMAVEGAKPGADEVGTEEAESAEDRPDRLGDYRILREVGRGGMGVVYEAEQVSLGRRVALKVLAPWLRSGPQQVQRFLREARSAARLQHPDIVPIFGVGEHEGRHYYAMQLIAGQGLDRVLDEVRRMKSPAPEGEDGALTRAAAWTRVDGGGGPGSSTGPRPGLGFDDPTPDLPVPGRAPRTPGRSDSTPADAPDAPYRRSVAEIVVHAAGALQYAHDQGMLHRDIKPSNLLLDERGKVWVTDFGLVKAIDGEDLTTTGDLVGTLRYMAPERFRGRCDARSDVYSLGLTLYEMLALRPAFEAVDRHRLIHQITQEEPTPIRRLLPGLPRDLATIVQTAIARDPDERYASAARLADDLGLWLRHEPIRARPSPLHDRAAKWARRNPTAAALAGAAALAAAAALAILAFGLVRVSRALDESRRISYFQRVALAERAWSGNDVGRAEELLDGTSPELRSWEWSYLKRLCHSDVARIGANSGEQPNALAFAPGGEVIATSGLHGDLILWQSPSGRRLRTIYGRPEGIRSIAFRPDGEFLAAAGAGGNDSVGVFEAATGDQVLSIRLAHGREALGVAYSPDGKTLATCSGVFWETVERSEDDGDLTIWDAATGRAIRGFVGHSGSIHQVAFSPDGRRLASAGGDGVVKVWDAATGEAVLNLCGHDDVVMGVAWGPDGRQLASAGLDGTIRTWDAATGEATASFREPGERFLALAWSPDGRTIAAAGRSWAVTAWDAATGLKVETYRGHNREAIGVAYSPDGRTLGSAGYDGVVRLWDARRGQDALTVDGFGSPVTDLAVDPRGRWIAAAPESRPLVLRDLATGGPGPELESRVASHGSAAFGPDGAKVVAGGREAPGLVEGWDAATGRRLFALEAGADAVRAVAWGPDGLTLAVGDAAGVAAVWDVATAKVVERLAPAAGLPITALAWSPDGLRLAASTGDPKRVHLPGRVLIWEPGSGRPPDELAGHRNGIADLAWSPDGLRIATASWDQSAGLWDVEAGARLHAFEVRGLLVWAVAFSPDGERVVASDNIGRMTFWDVRTGYEVLTLQAHADRIYDLAFGPEGRILLSAGRDALVKVRDASPPPTMQPRSNP